MVELMPNIWCAEFHCEQMVLFVLIHLSQHLQIAFTLYSQLSCSSILSPRRLKDR